MPITVELIRQGRVALQTYSDPLEMADMDALRSRMDDEIFAASTEKIHIIADFRQVRNLPGMILSRGANMLNNAHPNTGIVVAVMQNNFIYRMARAFSGLTPRRPLKIVLSFDDALKIVDDALATEQMRPSAG